MDPAGVMIIVIMVFAAVVMVSDDTAHTRTKK